MSVEKKEGNGERRLRRKINGGPAGEFLVFRRGGGEETVCIASSSIGRGPWDSKRN